MTKTKKVKKNLLKKLKCLKKFECRLSNTSLDIFHKKNFTMKFISITTSARNRILS